MHTTALLPDMFVTGNMCDHYWSLKRKLPYPYPITGFDFPSGPGAYAPRFCCGPLDFSEYGAQKSIHDNTEIPFLTTQFIRRPFRAPSLKSKCQTLLSTSQPPTPLIFFPGETPIKTGICVTITDHLQYQLTFPPPPPPINPPPPLPTAPMTMITPCNVLFPSFLKPNSRPGDLLDKSLLDYWYFWK